MSPAQARTAIDALIRAASAVILGKETALRLAITCLLARGHLLIEDLPGVGKTTLAHTLAKLFGLHYQRIQFTSDLLPADIIGNTLFDRNEQQFRFHPGPLFAQLILADEINRATPKAQSALLEAMEERQVTVDGETRPLPEPFFVIATQNPQYQIGTFPLPESQLDRFLMRITLGYPDERHERALLQGQDRRQLLETLQPVLNLTSIRALQGHAQAITVADALLDYVQALLKYSRQQAHYRHGLSPRAGLGLIRSAQAWALLAGREMVLPEDIQAVLIAVAGHRLRAASDLEASPEALAQRLLEAVPVP